MPAANPVSKLGYLIVTCGGSVAKGNPEQAPGRSSPTAGGPTRARQRHPLKTRLTLRPGQNGTKKLLHKYGDRLLAVRYCYDETRQRNVKTVELIEEELPWTAGRRRAHDLVSIRIGYEETALRERIKNAGGAWQKERKLWRIDYGTAQRLRLAKRIVE